MNSGPQSWKYLRRKPGSLYKQLFIFDKGRYVSARTVYGAHVNESTPMTVEEIVVDRDLPVEAVLEAIAYCESDPLEIRQDWEAEEALSEALGINDPNYSGKTRPITAQERARLNKL